MSGANIAIVFLGAYRLAFGDTPVPLAGGCPLVLIQRLRGEARSSLPGTPPGAPLDTLNNRRAPTTRPASTSYPAKFHALPLVHRLSTLTIPHRVMVCAECSSTRLRHAAGLEGFVIRSLAMGLGAYAMLRGSGRQSLAALQTTVLICLLAARTLAGCGVCPVGDGNLR